MKDKRKTTTQNPTAEIKKLLEQKGHKSLPLVGKAILEEKLGSKEAQEALKYFSDGWRDNSRAAILAMTCEAVGGNPELTTMIAVALSLISGGYDLHDDIVDFSTAKNGKATVLGRFGKNSTLLVGDALMLKGFVVLNKSLEDFTKEKRLKILEIVDKMFFELFDAEMLELKFRGSLEITPDQYLQIIRKKAADVEAHARIGAVIGGASPIQIDSLGGYGRALGMLVILRDEFLDVIDVEEAKHRYEKEHLPLPVVYVAKDRKMKNLLSELISKRPMPRKNALKILEITKNAGGFENTQKTMDAVLHEAINSLKGLMSVEDLQALARAISSVWLELEE